MLKWLAWGAAAVVGGYVTIVLLFASYFALAAYIPLLVRKVRTLVSCADRRSDPAA